MTPKATCMNVLNFSIIEALRDLVPFVKFKTREKHPCRSVSFNKIANFNLETLLKVTLLHRCFSRPLNCRNGIKSRKTSPYYF